MPFSREIRNPAGGPAPVSTWKPSAARNSKKKTVDEIFDDEDGDDDDDDDDDDNASVDDLDEDVDDDEDDELDNAGESTPSTTDSAVRNADRESLQRLFKSQGPPPPTDRLGTVPALPAREPVGPAPRSTKVYSKNANEVLTLRGPFSGCPLSIFNPNTIHDAEVCSGEEVGIPLSDQDRPYTLDTDGLQFQPYAKRDLYFTFTDDAIVFNVVRNAFKAAGFRFTTTDKWNGMWGKPLALEEYKDLDPYQKVNHFPGSWCLGRKDRLNKFMTAMRRRFGRDEYGFHPETYTLPQDYNIIAREMENSEVSLKNAWILKPCASSCGRGIRLVTHLNDLPKRRKCLAQRYVANPLLIDGFKFDLRIYVVCTSFDPLRLYLFDDGLVRFSTAKYKTDVKSASLRYMHLTNYSVNKKSKTFVANENADNDGSGSKWSIRALRRYFREQGIDDHKMWEDIKELLVKTIIAVESEVCSRVKQYVPYRTNCYELWGFDVLVDSNWRPWLIEVNIGPSLSSSSPLDKQIKSSLLANIVNLVGFHPYDREEFAREYEEIKQQRLMGLHGRSRSFSTDSRNGPRSDARSTLTSRGTASSSYGFSLDKGSRGSPYSDSSTHTAASRNNEHRGGLRTSSDSSLTTRSGSGGGGASFTTLMSWTGHISRSTPVDFLSIRDPTSLMRTLLPVERMMIEMTDSEYRRRGRFQRIFPCPGMRRYSKFFSSRRYSHELLERVCTSFTDGSSYLPLQWSSLTTTAGPHPHADRLLLSSSSSSSRLPPSFGSFDRQSSNHSAAPNSPKRAPNSRLTASASSSNVETASGPPEGSRLASGGAGGHDGHLPQANGSHSYYHSAVEGGMTAEEYSNFVQASVMVDDAPGSSYGGQLPAMRPSTMGNGAHIDPVIAATVAALRRNQYGGPTVGSGAVPFGQQPPDSNGAGRSSLRPPRSSSASPAPQQLSVLPPSAATILRSVQDFVSTLPTAPKPDTPAMMSGSVRRFSTSSEQIASDVDQLSRSMSWNQQIHHHQQTSNQSHLLPHYITPPTSQHHVVQPFSRPSTQSATSPGGGSGVPAFQRSVSGRNFYTGVVSENQGASHSSTTSTAAAKSKWTAVGTTRSSLQSFGAMAGGSYNVPTVEYVQEATTSYNYRAPAPLPVSGNTTLVQPVSNVASNQAHRRSSSAHCVPQFSRSVLKPTNLTLCATSIRPQPNTMLNRRPSASTIVS